MNFFLNRRLIIFLFPTLYSCYNLNPPSRSPLRVKNGRDVGPGQFTYVVRIELAVSRPNNQDAAVKYFHICTGSALTPTATLTASHCYLEELQATGLVKHVVRYGSTPGKPDDQLEKISDVLNITKPPAGWGMESPSFMDDLAIFTTEPIQLRSYGMISSLDYLSLLGVQVALMGYGVTNHSKLDTDTKSLNLPLQVIDGMLTKCEDIYTFPLLCTKSACDNPQGLIAPGDSGAPVVHFSGIIGINSKSLFEAYKVRPEYVNVPLPFQVLVMPLSPYIDWLTRTLRQITDSQMS